MKNACALKVGPVETMPNTDELDRLRAIALREDKPWEETRNKVYDTIPRFRGTTT